MRGPLVSIIGATETVARLAITRLHTRAAVPVAESPAQRHHCLYCKKCKIGICPYIMEFLDDLKQDKAFHEAVENAESCDNNHKQTLIMLKERLRLTAL